TSGSVYHDHGTLVACSGTVSTAPSLERLRHAQATGGGGGGGGGPGDGGQGRTFGPANPSASRAETLGCLADVPTAAREHSRHDEDHRAPADDGSRVGDVEDRLPEHQVVGHAPPDDRTRRYPY